MWRTPGKWEHELQRTEEGVRAGPGDGGGFIVEVALSGRALRG